jgi:hypothetical protein
MSDHPIYQKLDLHCQVHSRSRLGGQRAKDLLDPGVQEVRQHPDGRRHHKQMASDRRDYGNHLIPLKTEEAEYRTSNGGGDGCDGYDPRPFVQFQDANRQPDGATCENEQRKSSRDSHSSDCHGDGLSRVSARHSHDGNEKESDRAQGQARRSKERQDRYDCHTRGAFHAFSLPQALRIAEEAEAHCSSRLRTSGVTIGTLGKRNTFLNHDLDGCGASSSNAADVCASVCRTRDNSRAVRSGSLGRRVLRGHPSCDNPCGLYRRLGAEHLLPAVLQQLRWCHLPQGQRSRTAKRCNRVRGAYRVVLQIATPGFRILKSRWPAVCAWRRREDVLYRTLAKKTADLPA